MHARLPMRAVMAATMTVVIVACSNDAQTADDPADPSEDAISEAPAEVGDHATDPDAQDQPADQLDERGPAPEVVPYEQLPVHEQDGTQDLCAELAWGDATAVLEQDPADNIPEYLRWVLADPSGEERERMLALTAACAEVGWPPEM